MTDNPKKLSETARTLLNSAANRDNHFVSVPRLPVAAARQVLRSLLNAGLAEEVPGAISDATYAWPTGRDGELLTLRATALGIALAAEGDGAGPTAATAPIKPVVATSPVVIVREGGVSQQRPVPAAVEPKAAEVTEAAEDGSAGAAVAAHAPVAAADASLATDVASRRQRPASSLHRAAQALIDTWDRLALVDGCVINAMHAPIARLRAALTTPSALAKSSGKPKDTKRAQVLAMLRRSEGASGPQIAEATGWAPQTVRGFLAGLARKGINVGVLERVRQIGPNRRGSTGSYSVYWLAGEAKP